MTGSNIGIKLIMTIFIKGTITHKNNGVTIYQATTAEIY